MALTIFTATTATGAEPWITDGTTAGTTQLRDIAAGAGGSDPFGYTVLTPGRVVFVATNAAGAPSLYVSDGTPGGTIAISALPAGLANAAGSFSATSLGNGRLVFQATNSGTGRIEVWSTDGTAGGTALVTTVRGGTAGFGADAITLVGNGLAVFQERVADNVTALWTTDGTAAGTGIIGTFAGGGVSAPGNLTAFGTNGLALFRAAGAEGAGAELWVTNGTAAGTALLRDLVPGASGSTPYGFAPLGDGRMLFGAANASGTYSLYTTDGTAAGTSLFYTSPDQSATVARAFTPIGGGRAVFQASYLPGQAGSLLGNNEVWVTDGTAAGTLLVADIPEGFDASNPNSFTSIGFGRFVFQAKSDTAGTEAWISNGTPGGTVLLRDILPGAAGAVIGGFTAIVDGRAVFQADNGVNGPELWATDGTPGGTGLLRDIVPGAGGSSPASFTPLVPVALTPAPVRFSGTVVDRAGNQVYDGVGPTDTVVFNEVVRGAVFTPSGAATVLAHAGQTEVAYGVETMRFIDGRMVFNPSDPAAQVARLYQAGLGRLGEQEGLNFWINYISAGNPLSTLADAFLTLPEFGIRFGANLSNEAFVTRIYQNVLGRDPEAAGFNFFTGNLNSGLATRADVLAGISESTENRVVTAALVQAGIWDRSEPAQQVARLYDTALGRLPDTGGLAFWTNAIEAGTATLNDLAQAFVTSAEFVATYGALGNQAFVENVYGNTLGRAGDAEGVNFWTNALNNGISRADVTIGFSESREHQLRTASNTGGETPDTFGIRVA